MAVVRYIYLHSLKFVAVKVKFAKVPRKKVNSGGRTE